MALPRLSRPGAGAEGRLQVEPCRHACHACGLGNVKASWLGGGGSPPVRGPKGRPVRADIPELVATLTMLVLYASRPGSSRACKAKAEGGRQKAEGERRKAKGGRQKAEVGSLSRCTSGDSIRAAIPSSRRRGNVVAPRRVKAARARRTPNDGNNIERRAQS